VSGLTDKTSERQEVGGKIDRRSFLQWSMLGLLAAMGLAALNVVVRFLLPPPKEYKATELSIPAGQIPSGSSMVVEYKGAPAIVIHTENGIAAFDATCTHLGCIVKWVRKEEIFLCPCHAGRFDRTGKVLSGPPPEPLHKIKIKLTDNNIVFL